MVTDPSLCPIPPGFELLRFEVLGVNKPFFNDDFDDFKN